MNVDHLKNSIWLKPRNLLFGLIRKTTQDDCFSLASELAYSLIFSLVPMSVFFTSLCGLIGGQKQVYPIIIGFITKISPNSVLPLLTDMMDAIIEGTSPDITIIGVLGLAWSALNTGSIILKGFHKICGNGSPINPWNLLLPSFFIFFIFGSIMALSVYIAVFGDLLLSYLFLMFKWNNETFPWLSGSRWIIVLGGVFWSTTFIYRIGFRQSAESVQWGSLYKGAAFFVFSWLIMSLVLKLYLQNFQMMNPVYGILGAVIIFLTWLYHSSLMFFVGAEISVPKIGIHANRQ